MPEKWQRREARHSAKCGVNHGRAKHEDSDTAHQKPARQKTKSAQDRTRAGFEKDASNRRAGSDAADFGYGRDGFPSGGCQGDRLTMANMDIRPPSGSRKKKRIVGRGPGGRRGATAGRGDKGQNSRSGGGVRPGFEGGQMPLYRRIPRKGFSNARFRKDYDVVNVGVLDNRYTDGETVSLETLKGKRIIKKRLKNVKILGAGDLDKKLTVLVDAVSASARRR